MKTCGTVNNFAYKNKYNINNVWLQRLQRTSKSKIYNLYKLASI